MRVGNHYESLLNVFLSGLVKDETDRRFGNIQQRESTGRVACSATILPQDIMMKMRHPLRFVLLVIWTLTVYGVALAQDSQPAPAHYPEKSLRLVVPYPAGGGADYWGRLVAKKLTDPLGQSVVVETLAKYSRRG